MGSSGVYLEVPKPSDLEANLDSPFCHLQWKPGHTISRPEGFIQVSAHPVLGITEVFRCEID